jgi:hypothetical protein
MYYPADDCNIGTRYGASNQILPKPTIDPLLIRHKKANERKPEQKSDQGIGDKSRSKRKKRENSKTMPQVSISSGNEGLPVQRQQLTSGSAEKLRTLRSL